MDYREAALKAFHELDAKSTEDLIVEYIVGGQNAPGHPSVELLVTSRLMKHIADSTSMLNEATNKVRQEVAILADSSERLERLTAKLKNLTWALILLTIVAALVPVGIEVWKAYR